MGKTSLTWLNFLIGDQRFILPVLVVLSWLWYFYFLYNFLQSLDLKSLKCLDEVYDCSMICSLKGIFECIYSTMFYLLVICMQNSVGAIKFVLESCNILSMSSIIIILFFFCQTFRVFVTFLSFIQNIWSTSFKFIDITTNSWYFG